MGNNTKPKEIEIKEDNVEQFLLFTIAQEVHFINVQNESLIKMVKGQSKDIAFLKSELQKKLK